MPPTDKLTREELVGLIADLWRVNQEQQERILLLEGENARLKGGPPPSPPREPPSFVKPNCKTQEERKAQAEAPPKARRRRARGHARRQAEPGSVSRVVAHHPEACDECGRRFGPEAGWKHATRQIIELPALPFEVTEHRFYACKCGVCGHRTVARPDLSSEAPGKSRLGVRLMGLIAYLDTACRMPVRTIQQYLRGVYGLHLSVGAIVRVLHQVARAGQSMYEDLLRQVRLSRVVGADETGARENGINGYMWTLVTGTVRYFHRDASRGSAVIQTLLGYDPAVLAARSPRSARHVRAERQRLRASPESEGGSAEAEAEKPAQPGQPGQPAPVRFHGGLVSDFYGGYDWYRFAQQRCLVHLDRDLDALRDKHAEDPMVCAWVQTVLGVIERAKEYAAGQQCTPTHAQARRASARRGFEREIEQLARPYRGGLSALPQRVLSDRLHRYQRGLFLFVEFPDEVPPDNNASERAIRPFVTLRKVSGGTRSAQGSRTLAVLLSLFQTWSLRGHDALDACQRMLAGDPIPTTA